jgi:excisionase family DNA binding protein
MDERLSLVADGLVTVKDAADFLGLGRTSIYALMEGGHLPYFKAGRARRIPKRALAEFAARNLRGGWVTDIDSKNNAPALGEGKRG